MAQREYLFCERFTLIDRWSSSYYSCWLFRLHRWLVIFHIVIARNLANQGDRGVLIGLYRGSTSLVYLACLLGMSIQKWLMNTKAMRLFQDRLSILTRIVLGWRSIEKVRHSGSLLRIYVRLRLFRVIVRHAVKWALQRLVRSFLVF